MFFTLEPSWQQELKDEIAKPYFLELTKTITNLYQNETVYPPFAKIFNAFTLCPFTDVKVVILGQDPYHQAKQAHGLAFSVPEGIKLPPSLRNIYKELSSDLEIETPESGNLGAWAKQGVLLLNSTLTVLPDKPNSHQNLGWQTFTDAVIKLISDQKTHMVFILWGKYAETKESLVDKQKHLILKSAHPSPLSAHKGFFGSRPFSQANDYLRKNDLEPIRWY